MSYQCPFPGSDVILQLSITVGQQCEPVAHMPQQADCIIEMSNRFILGESE